MKKSRPLSPGEKRRQFKEEDAKHYTSKIDWLEVHDPVRNALSNSYKQELSKEKGVPVVKELVEGSYYRVEGEHDDDVGKQTVKRHFAPGRRKSSTIGRPRSAFAAAPQRPVLSRLELSDAFVEPRRFTKGSTTTRAHTLKEVGRVGVEKRRLHEGYMTMMPSCATGKKDVYDTRPGSRQAEVSRVHPTGPTPRDPTQLHRHMLSEGSVAKLRRIVANRIGVHPSGGGGWQWGHGSVEPIGRTRSDFAFYEGLHHQKKDMSAKVQGFDVAFPLKVEKGHVVGTPYEKVVRRPLSARERAQRRRDGLGDQSLDPKEESGGGKTVRVVLHPTRKY